MEAILARIEEKLDQIQDSLWINENDDVKDIVFSILKSLDKNFTEEDIFYETRKCYIQDNIVINKLEKLRKEGDIFQIRKGVWQIL